MQSGGCDDTCVAAETSFVNSIATMFAPGSYLSSRPKLTCELKGRFQKSSLAALIGASEDFFWNLSLAMGRSLPSITSTNPNHSFREYLDSFQCPYPAAVVTPINTKPDTPITIVPETVYPPGTPACDKRVFESSLNYMPENPSERSLYQNLTYEGNPAVVSLIENYNSKCSVSSPTLFNPLI